MCNFALSVLIYTQCVIWHTTFNFTFTHSVQFCTQCVICVANFRCFFAGPCLSKIHALLSVKFSVQNLCGWKKDKYEVSQVPQLPVASGLGNLTNMRYALDPQLWRILTLSVIGSDWRSLKISMAIREAYCYQNQWFFWKFPNRLWPPSLIHLKLYRRFLGTRQRCFSTILLSNKSSI